MPPAAAATRKINVIIYLTIALNTADIMGPPSYTENGFWLHKASIPYLLKNCKPFSDLIRWIQQTNLLSLV